MLLKLGALLLLASFANAESVRQYPYHSTQDDNKPAGQENVPGCYISDLETIIPFDQVYYPDAEDDLDFYTKCAKYTCESETFNAYQFSCNFIRKKEGCKIIEGDKSAKYPACCDRQVCDSA